MKARYYLGRILLTIILTFCIAGFIGVSNVKNAISDSTIYTDIVEKEDLPEKILETLQSDFEKEYNTTMIPAEVYMNVITADWIETAMKQNITAVTEIMTGANSLAFNPDYTALEKSISDYFYEYAESINYEPDEIFDEKLQETIDNAESKINSRIDAFYFQTLSENGIISKICTIYPYITYGMILLLALAIIIIVVLIMLDENGGWRRIYFPGTAFFCGGAIMAVPSAYLLLSGTIQNFSIKDPVVFTAITSLIESLTEKVLLNGVYLGGFGLAVIIICIAFNKKKSESAKTEDVIKTETKNSET